MGINKNSPFAELNLNSRLGNGRKLKTELNDKNLLLWLTLHLATLARVCSLFSGSWIRGGEERREEKGDRGRHSQLLVVSELRG